MTKREITEGIFTILAILALALLNLLMPAIAFIGPGILTESYPRYS